ncbi:Por secretion system C-terminal sorting domain-containing protein [Pustulibacterium marinum]|uniref:Por secretion system C-terminal sorting domain-containing protein n=1 Tax=Pustulibacterium marinum TaxID=1224947 RepID=A0A1I7FRD8_9FLAO|nr:T9SS type A sorting domain-containing protein [Pustulibacterium marinum]SFU38566.1 Por secretion system C-terminal sorting domain-containing protein [Pustulibacterium marinum]
MKKFYFLLLLLSTLQIAQLQAASFTFPIVEDVVVLQKDEQVKVFYNKSSLYITGLNEKATIEIYNMLGKRVADFSNVQLTNNFNKRLSLPMNNIFIVSVQTENFKKTFKIVTK